MAPTSDPADDVTEAWGFELGLRVFRGDRTDVLSRFLTIGAEAWAALEDPDIEVLQVASIWSNRCESSPPTPSA
ncbi:MAG: hypothetical protein H8E78_10690 [Proteobacteria bacterium]|nr:hypothetical protein [Pseudomonadota bacterium]